MNDRQVLVRDLLVWFALTGWALALPAFGSDFVVSMALTCLMYVALSSSWGLFCGSTRYLCAIAGEISNSGIDRSQGNTQAILAGCRLHNLSLLALPFYLYPGTCAVSAASIEVRRSSYV